MSVPGRKPDAMAPDAPLPDAPPPDAPSPDAGPAAADAVDVSATALILEAVEAVLDKDGASLVPPQAIQNLIAAGCRAYAARIEAGDSFPPIPHRGPVTSTDVMVTVSALLRAVDLNTFELGMWQSWTGR